MNNTTVAASMRHVLRCAMRLLALALFVLSLPVGAANFTDLWWNKDESGWGLTLAHHNDKIFGVWFVYDTDGKPFWVSMSDGVASSDGLSFTGALYRTSGPSYRGAFDRDRVKIAPVGSARLDFTSDGTGLTLNYSIGDLTTTKRLGRMPYGSVPANFPDDHSDLWWNPAESGWGLALSHHGNTVFGVWYTYDEDGRPLWIILPDGRVTAPNTISGKLYIPSGSPYTQVPFDQRQTRTSEVGSATLVMGKDDGVFTSTVNGFTQTKRISRIGFGTPRPVNALPTIALDVSGTALAPARLTLKATAADSDGRITKVEFYNSCDRITEVLAAPFQAIVPNLPVGTYTFSARAFDDRGGSTLVTSAPIEVKSSGSGTIPPAGNAPPTVSIATPSNGAFFTQGATVELTASAKDADGTVKKVEYLANGMKMGEATVAPWRVTWTSVAGDYQLTAVATDDKGATGTSIAVAISVAGPAVALDNPTKDAARFLTQATFGMNGVAELDALKARGYASWLDEQLGIAAASHVQYVNDRKAAGESAAEERAYEAIWQQWLFEPGQLRARMTFALSEIFVISNIAPDLDTYAMASYMDMLNRNAFGNYRQLLEEVALHPAMGYYLNMIGSKKANPAKGTHPNENFAREVMQLFSIGLYRLNPDGTRQLDAQGQAVPTYDQTVVGGMAAAFSGWNFAGNDVTKPSAFDPAKENWLDPMTAWEAYHDTDAKTIVNGVTLPAGQNARADLKGALDALYNHPNVGPFIGRQLIQRFVTSNPSPAYIARVTGAFANNGQGVRGDLKAVIRAVLMDPEARDMGKLAEPSWGKQREPVIRFANFLRAFNATSPSGRNRIWYLDSADEGLNQSPLLSPSVFNFFSPNYRQPGPLSAAGLVAPEFQITTETSMVGGLNFFGRLVKNGSYGSGETKLTLNLAEITALAANPAALADRLNVLLLAGAMSDALRANIVATLSAIAPAKSADRVKAALTLVAVSPDYAIQK